jgi:regulator of cell morphogenesis and NO signaling
MEELVSKTLAQIVTDHYQAAGVFEKYGLDFCCKGKRSLEKACIEKSLPIEEIEVALKESFHQPADKDVANLSLTDLSDYIVNTHHAYVKEQGPQLLFFLQKIASKHGDRHPELQKVLKLFIELKADLDQHLQKEERILFPRIKEMESNPGHLDPGYLNGPVSVMEHEHEEAGTILEQLRTLTGNYTPPADACTTYKLSYASLQAFEADLHKHVHLENNILFPRAQQLLKARESK